MPTAGKAEIINETKLALQSAQSAVLAEYRGLTVQQMNSLRKMLNEGGVTLRVIKNTLIRRAADEAGIEGLTPYLTGPTAVAFSTVDPVAAAKLMARAQREYRRIEVKAGILSNRAIDAQSVRQLADLPPREELLGKVAGTLVAPIQRLVWAMNGPITNLARALDQVRAQKEAQA